MAHSRRAHGTFFNEMRLQRAMRAMALRASSAPLMRQTVHPGVFVEECFLSLLFGGWSCARRNGNPDMVFHLRRLK